MSHKQEDYFHAIIDGDIETVKELASYDTLAATDACGRTALIAAIFYCLPDELLILSKKSGFNLKQSKGDMVDLLIELGSNINSQDHEGNSPLHYATISGNVNALNKLIATRANLNIVNIAGNTPLMQSVISYSKEATAILLASGADTQIRNRSGKTVFDIAKDDPEIYSILESHILKNSITEASNTKNFRIS